MADTPLLYICSQLTFEPFSTPRNALKREWEEEPCPKWVPLAHGPNIGVLSPSNSWASSRSSHWFLSHEDFNLRLTWWMLVNLCWWEIKHHSFSYLPPTIPSNAILCPSLVKGERLISCNVTAVPWGLKFMSSTWTVAVCAVYIRFVNGFLLPAACLSWWHLTVKS